MSGEVMNGDEERKVGEEEGKWGWERWKRRWGERLRREGRDFGLAIGEHEFLVL